MDFENIVPVEWSNQRVLTTAQLAEYYECEVRHISDNFKRNESRFKAGKHYFRIEGEALKQFKNCSAFNGLVGLRAPALYLWTVRGAARHAKMLSTDQAWEVFETLEDNYFNPKTDALNAPAPLALKNSKRSEAQRRVACVYVLLMSNNIVKIGISGKLRSRVAKIKRDTGLTVKDIYFSPFMSREDARLIEWACQEKFSSRRIKGEFFSATFEEVCSAVDNFAKSINLLPKTSKKFFMATKQIADKESD